MISKLIQILLIILFITLPLINSHLLDFFGLSEFGENFYVNGNYEFSKVIYFNIFSSIILLLFFIKNIFNKKLYIPKITYYIIPVLIISTIFSISPEISLFGNTDKAHSLLMFVNLIGIYLILINSDYSLRKSILFWSVLGLFPIIYFAGGEFFRPSYDYGDLTNRAFGTFGHPNYLALYLLLFLPIITKNKTKLNRNLNYFLIIGIISAIILSKSIIAISLLILYKIYYLLFKARFKHIKTLYFIIALVGILFMILQNFGYSKLHSFISRFYIWGTTWNIISSDIKTFFIGNGTETLGLIFDNFKSPYLYIFENFGFTADRPHNIFLNIFYHFGILGLSIFSYLIYKLFKLKNSSYKISLTLALIFLCFNYSSIASYLVIILIILLINKGGAQDSPLYKNFLILFLITFFSISGGYYSYKLYNSEILNYNGRYIEAKTNYIFGEEIYKIKTCEEELESGNKSVETYFYCGDIKYNKNNPETGIKYYRLGLEKLPDLWNKESSYYENIFVKETINGKRFFSPKYSDLLKILKRVGIKK